MDIFDLISSIVLGIFIGVSLIGVLLSIKYPKDSYNHKNNTREEK